MQPSRMNIPADEDEPTLFFVLCTRIYSKHQTRAETREFTHMIGPVAGLQILHDCNLVWHKF